MPRLRLSGPFRLLLAAAAIAVFVVASVDLLSSSTSSAQPSRQFQSIFEDDNLLVYQSRTAAGDAAVERTLKRIKSLGANRVRVIVQWSYIAPTIETKGFIAANPATYSPCSWIPYDRIDRMAQAAGLSVYFDVTDPGPAWAMTAGGPAAFANHYAPDEADVEQFLLAMGERYDGHYTPTGSCPGAALNDSGPLPRVSFWSLWNEPNQPGWLAPQYTGTGHPIAPALYRAYVTGFWEAMTATGHTPKTDTLLIGEMASEGCRVATVCGFAGGPTEAPIPPITFLQALYCVGANYRPLTGAAAYDVACPTSGNRQTFVKDNPGLFETSGLAHHPYDFSVAPGVSVPETTFAPLADLGRLERALDAVFSTYGVDRELPIYLTEYGYVTNPPNPLIAPTVTPALQAAYINQAQYMAYRDARVRGLSQFELQDAPPNRAFPPSSPRYWETFQTGLEFLGGKPKPSLAAYRLPIFLPQSTAGANGTVTVWGMARAAAVGKNTTVQIQWRSAKGTYEPLANVMTKDRFILDSVEIPASGFVRLEWDGYFSRASPVVRS